MHHSVNRAVNGQFAHPYGAFLTRVADATLVRNAPAAVRTSQDALQRLVTFGTHTVPDVNRRPPQPAR